MLHYLLLITAFASFLFFLWFFIVSLLEKEALAAKRSLFLAIITPLPFLALNSLNFQYQCEISIAVLGLFALLIIVLIAPVNKLKKLQNENPLSKYDERDTMFSRKEITNQEDKRTAYYNFHPESLKIDTEWRQKPGLMSEKSSMYSLAAFTAADASFYAIESLRNQVDGKPNEKKKNLNSKELTIFINKWSKKLGAIDVGICELQSHHFYSVRGRGANYGKEVNNKHKYGIALTVEMDKDFLATGPAGPTLMESAQQYLNSGVIAIQLAKFIRELGFEARAHIDGNYEVICPLVARDTGIGEIGRMGLLMTPTLGPRIRIAVVTTNAPLEIDVRKPDYSVHDFCTICKKCADVCPSQAIDKDPMKVIDGAERWQINQEKCFSYWCTSGTDCGRCMSVCPYSHPNNLLHNIVRWGIKSSWLFRRFALLMDDFFYGRKPKPVKIPEWMNLKEK